jgi:hypothetical protein
MKIIKIKSPALQFGYFSDKKFSSHKHLCLIFFDIFWNKKTGRWGFGIAIPYVYAIGICF